MGGLLVPLHIAEINSEAESRHEQELDRLDGAGNDHRRHELEAGAAPDLGKTWTGGAAPLWEPGARLAASARAQRNRRLAPRRNFTVTHLLIALLQTVTPRLAEAGSM